MHCISVTTFQGIILKPRRGNIVLYFRNLHLLKPDAWGSNVTIEFLRQLIEYKRFYHEKTEFVRVQNIIIIGTMLPTHKISSRFLSKLHLMNIELPEKEDLSVITVAYLSALIKTTFPVLHFPKKKIVKLALTMISILERAKTMFMSLHHYYILSPHDLIVWCTTLKYYSIFESDESDLRLLEVVCYEAIRMFTDRIVSLDDKQKLNTIIDDIFKINWGINQFTEKVSNFFYVSKSDLSSEKPLFERYLKEAWRSDVEHGIIQFGKEHQEFIVVINEEILHLTAAIMRVAAIPDYNTLLIGKAGVGRKTAIKIASTLLSTQVIYPSSGNYPLFHNDLKLAIQHSGVEGNDVFLILEDYTFSTEKNSNLINLLMTSGEVADLFTDLEMESLVKGLKEKCDSKDFDGDLIQFFADNIKRKLHIFVILDQDNKNLRNIFLNCPVFSQKCGLLWLEKWNDNTIEIFPTRLVELLHGPHKKDEDFECSNGFNYIYKSLSGVVPSRYISMVKLYYTKYKEKKNSIKSNISKLKSGVSKLTAAKDLVKELKEKAAEQQQKLAEKQSKANAALDMISNTIKGANTHKEEMEILKSKTEEENAQIMKRKTEIEKELADVEPLIRDASAAVENIKTESLSEIRSLRAPPEIIRDILEGVLKLMGTQDTSWNSMKTFLAKRGVKEEIRSFDASRIQTENRQAVEKLMSMKKESFDLKHAKRASVAAAPLAAWVEANVKYSKVLDKIRPLEREQHKLKQNLVNAETQLDELKGSLLDVDTTVAKLKEKLSLYTKEAAELEIDLEKVHQTLTSAETLVSKLEDEYQRWQEQLEEFSKELDLLPNNCLLGAATITFLSEEPESNRRNMILKWCSELKVMDFDFILFFSTERQQLHWEAEGLPKNRISLENAIFIQQGILSPVLIDPTSTAVHWLKEHYIKRGQHFEHANYNSLKFNTVLEASVRFGKILLVEEIEDSFQALLPILREEYIYRGERKMISILGRKVDYHSDFKLIMCTKNEHFLPPAEVAPYITILNFNVTYSGFTEQLLSSAITQEKPELESRRKDLLRENEELQEKLHILQNQLLECLVNSNENILNDKKLLITLNDTKTSFMAIAEALSESKQIQNTLRKKYEIFLEISSFGSILYMACKEFSKYNILYSLSANSYSKLFLLCIKTIQLGDGNMESPKKQLFQSVYNYMSRGMFKSDRLPFFFHLVYRTFPNEIPENEINIFLSNGVHQKIDKVDAADLSTWLPSTVITQINYLKYCFPDLVVKSHLNESHKWEKFMESPQCEKDFPSFCELSEFQKLLIIQSLRPDRLLPAIDHCLLRVSGLQTIDPPVLSLQETFNESTEKEPILFIATSGMDPSMEIRDLAEQLRNGYEEISMGEGQEGKAIASLEECKKNGKWLILKNVQLVTYWLPILFQNMNDSNFSHSFRLWLISTPTQNFNIVLAQYCLKIAYEEPRGIGNNMQRIYASLGEKYESQMRRTSARIFFGFSCLHALLQERRNYIPQGWTKYYEFNHTDIQTCLILTEDLWNVDTTRVQWESIKGLVNEAVYSGRIENIYDKCILDAYLKIYFNDDILSYKWKPLGLNVILPKTSEMKEYSNIIKQFPKKDQPLMFGLPENIDRARGEKITQELIAGLKELYLKENTELVNQETHFRNCHSYITLWKKINEGLDFIKLSVSKESTGDSAIKRFIHEEYTLGIKLVQIIHKCFTGLKKISKGIMEPDDDDIIVATSISQHQTPQHWLDIWNGPRDPTQFLQELLQKTTYIWNWTMEQGDMLKQPIKLSQFFCPETFFASLKQDYARSSSTSLDNLALRTSWNYCNENGIVLSDLLVEGAFFENKTMVPCKINSQNINLVPECYLYWTSQNE